MSEALSQALHGCFGSIVGGVSPMNLVSLEDTLNDARVLERVNVTTVRSIAERLRRRVDPG